MHIINNICIYAHQTELSACFTQTLAEHNRADRSNMVINYQK